MDSFLDPTCVPVGISINKLDLVPDRIVAGLVGMFRNRGSLVTGESYIPVVFLDPLLHRPPCFPDVDFAVLAGNPVDKAILFSRVDGILWFQSSVTDVSCQIRRQCECLVDPGSGGDTP